MIRRAAFGAAMALAVTAAAAQSPQQTVIKPAPVDPAMRVKPPARAKLPTPVIKPHPDQGNTVVVPK